MQTLGLRIDFHIHSLFSDGKLLPAALAYEALYKNHSAIAITDHVDPSNLSGAISAIMTFVEETERYFPIKIIPGVEISYLPPPLIEKYAAKAKHLGAKVVLVHGESPVEPVPGGTNHAALQLAGLVDILAHPGWITEEDTILAKVNHIYLELSAKSGHRRGNRHVAKMAKAFGAKLLVNTDAHSEKDLITQEKAFRIAAAAGLSAKEARAAVRGNPDELLASLGYSIPKSSGPSPA